MKRTTLLFIMMLSAICGWAQTNAFSLDGYVRDDFTNAGIADANVYLLNNDSIVQDSAKTLSGYSSGFFRFNVKRDKSFRSCIIKVVHPSYKTSYSLRTLKNVGKNAGYEVPTIFVNRRNLSSG